MAWTQWMRSRLVNLVVASSLILPMGAPSVFAFAKADHLRAASPKVNKPTQSAIDEEIPPPGAPSGYQGGPGAAWTGDAVFRGPTFDILAQRVTSIAGAQTGQVHIDAAVGAGATGIIAGHSETRPGSPTPINDTEPEIHHQIVEAVDRGVRTIILAVGETEQPAAVKASEVPASFIADQVAAALNGLTEEQLRGRLIVAYEPRWAIGGSGTGVPATPEYAQAAHQAIRNELRKRFGDAFAAGTRIIYGGSATAANAAEFLAQEDIDGLLVGGASASTAKFVPIVKTAQTLAADKKARTGRSFYIGGNQKTYPVDESPETFVSALATVDPSLVQIGIAPQLSSITTWRTAAESVDAAREQAAAKAAQVPSGPVQLAVQQSAIANPNAGSPYLGALIPKAESVEALLTPLKGIVEFNLETGGISRILDEHRLRTETVHQLAAEAFLSSVPDVKATAQWLLRAIGPKLGVGEASAFALHQARAAGKWGHATIPAFNIRTGPPYHTLMTLFDAAIEQKVGAVMVEIAKSEQGYAIDIEEYVSAVYAAAIARGFTGPLFIQADHYQITPDDYNKKDPDGAAPGTMKKKAVAAMLQHLIRSAKGGMLNLDLDSSTLVKHDIVEHQILPLKVAYTNRYIQARMKTDPIFAKWVSDRGGLKDRIFDEQPELRALRHKLWDDLMMVALEETGPTVLEEALGQNALRLPDLAPYLEQLELTVAQEQARYVNPVTREGRTYNSPELYGMSAAGYHESLRGVNGPEGFEPFITREELKTLIGLYRDIQKDNLAASLELLVGVRQYEREHGLPTIDMTYEEEHTDNEILVNEHPSSALGTIVFTGLALKQAEQAGVEPFTTLALQTGTMHGIGGDPDWGIHVRVNLTIAGSGIAGTDQHGTSTVNPARFADMPTAGVLSDHLATEYQRYTFAMIAQVPELVDQIGQFLEGVLYPDKPIADPAIAAKVKGAAGKPSGKKLEKFQGAWEQAMREGEAAGKSRRQVVANLITDSKDLGKVKGKLKDVTKLASKPFAVEISQLPPELKAQNYLKHMEEFRRIFQVQNVANTIELVQQHAGFDVGKVVLPPSPEALVEAVRAAAGSAQLPPSIEVARALANSEVTTVVRVPAQLRPSHGQDSAVAIAAGTIHLRGDTAVSKGNKDTAAEKIADAVDIVHGVRDHYMAVEGALDVSYGELQPGGVHETGFVVNPQGLGPHEYSLWDHIEVTEGFHTDRNGSPRNADTSNPGSTTLHAWGDGVKNHGVVPEMYAMVIAANVPLAKLAEYDERPIDPLMDAENPHDELLAILTRLAADNRRTLDDMEVVIMKRKREQAILEALQKIQQEHPGLVITQVSDGTVDPARLAMAGRKSGKYLVALEMGKSTEGTHNLFESAILNRSRGAVFGMRYVSKNINHVLGAEGKVVGKDAATNQAARFRWTSKESNDLRAFRLQDAEAILAGTKLFTPADVKGAVEIAVPMLTDNPWFNLPGARQLPDGDTVRVTTLRLSSARHWTTLPHAEPQGADMWVEVDDISRKSVERMVAQAPFVLQEPAAADLAVVDQEGKLLALMKGPESHTVLVHPGVSAQTPGFFIAWERALERFRQQQGLKTLEDAVKLSAVRLLVVLPEGPTHFEQLITAVNTASKGATQLKPEWFTVVTSIPSEPLAAAIGPSAWLQTVSNATVKVALDVPVEEGKATSAAAALYAMADAVAAGGKADPTVLAKLDVLEKDGVLVPQKVEVVEPEAVQSYQKTVHEVGGGV